MQFLRIAPLFIVLLLIIIGSSILFINNNINACNLNQEENDLFGSDVIIGKVK